MEVGSRGLKIGFLVAALMVSPQPATAQADDPADEEELRILRESIDVREYLLTLPEDRLDSLESVFNDLGEREPEIYIASAEGPRIMVRSIASRSRREDDKDELREKNVVRWDGRNALGEGAFGELSLDLSPAVTQATTMTWQYAGGSGSWELAVGDVTDRSATPLVTRSGPFNIRDVERLTAVPARRTYSKPSFLRDSFSFRGVGARYDPTDNWSILASAGTERGSDPERTVGRLAFRTASLPWLEWGGSAQKLHDGLRYGGGVRLTLERSELSAEWSHRNSGGQSGLLRARITPERSIRVQTVAWRRSLERGGNGVDEGFGLILRWRPVKELGVTTTYSGARQSSDEKATLTRSYARLRIEGRVWKKVSWSFSLRRTGNESLKKEYVGSGIRNEIIAGLRVPLSRGMRTSVRIRRSVSSELVAGDGSSIEWTIRRYGESSRVSAWVGLFRAPTGLSIWSTHPGFTMWPVQVVYSGAGCHAGLSLMLMMGEGFRAAGYISSIVREADVRTRLSVMVQVGL